MKQNISTRAVVLVITVVIIVVGLFYMWLASPNKDAKHKEDIIMGSAMKGQALPSMVTKKSMPK